jgi:hypothetical protein
VASEDENCRCLRAYITPRSQGVEKLKYKGGWKYLKFWFSPGKKKINRGEKKNPMMGEGRGKVNYLRFPNRFTGCKGRACRHYLFWEGCFH